jgi:beta-RFAP synthase
MDSVTVSVPARLHLGFLDLNGGLGRKFGSIGLALSEPVTRLRLQRATEQRRAGPESGRGGAILDRLKRDLDIGGDFALTVHDAIPAHAGLGSGTQIALAVAAALRSLCGLALDPRGDARRLGRGARSGIGIGLFEAGGLVVDAGRSSSDSPPPIIARQSFPQDWRILLILDKQHQGIHGADEIAAFAALPPFPESEAAHLCRLVLMQVLPALIERDVAVFAGAIAEMQRRLGDHFAAAQGGRYSSPRVAHCAEFLEAAGCPGCGQSSWGPTGFGFAGSEAEAVRLSAAARQEPALKDIEIRIIRGSNTGAQIVPEGGH